MNKVRPLERLMYASFLDEGCLKSPQNGLCLNGSATTDDHFEVFRSETRTRQDAIGYIMAAKKVNRLCFRWTVKALGDGVK